MDTKTKVAFDVDGTLMGIDGKPNYPIINLLIAMSAYCDIYVWSGGGAEYAEYFMDKLGLRKYIVRCYGKDIHNTYNIDIAFDDEKVTLAKVNIKI